jgi:hypothetical protein
MGEYVVSVEWYQQGKTKILREKFASGPVCLPQIPQGVTWDRTHASALSDRGLTARSVARPVSVFFRLLGLSYLNYA